MLLRELETQLEVSNARTQCLGHWDALIDSFRPCCAQPGDRPSSSLNPDVSQPADRRSLNLKIHREDDHVEADLFLNCSTHHHMVVWYSEEGHGFFPLMTRFL